MVDGFHLCPGGNAKILVVVLHGWMGGPAGLKDVIAATEDAFREHGGVDIYAPQLPLKRRTGTVRAAAVIRFLLSQIDQIVDNPAKYQRVVLIGYSFGAVLVRRLFLIAAGKPPGFRYEQLLEAEPARTWAALVDRLVTLGAFNRGWQVTGRTNWIYSIWLNWIGLRGHIFPNRLTPTICDVRQGAPFIVQTRLHWLAYRRFHQELRGGKVTEEKDRAREVARTQDPIVVQLIGTQDNLASPFDQIDILVDGEDPATPQQDRRYFFVEMKDTDHRNAKVFSTRKEGGDAETPEGNRRKLFILALTKSPAALHQIATNPALLADDLPQIDRRVTDTVFIMHGIRDDGFWTHRIAKMVRETARDPVAIRVRTPTYGYFAMLPFVLPWIRRQKVEWFMDQYVSVKAQFPNSKISYIGHSNGTYLAALGLHDYPAASFKHIFFAGSVVTRKYDWRSLIASGRVEKVHNVRASADSVVALLPKSIEYWKNFDLGGAGFDGFDQAGTDPNISQPERFADGGHSAAIAESQWPYIAQFIIDGTRPPERPSSAFVLAPSPWLLGFARMHVVLPALIFLCLLVIPILIAWPLWPIDLGHGWEWPRPGLTLPAAIADTLALVSYFLLLKFVITRV